MPAKIEGGCLCGACRYSSDATPINIRVCHCRRCQKATGSAFFARVLVPLDSLASHGPVEWFDCNTGVRRGFCTICGTALFSERKSANVIGVSMGSLDHPDRFPPAEHIWVSSRQEWLQLNDGLPQFPGAAPDKIGNQ